ncbi:hypothetical protein [Nocardia sp. NPDC050718]|uniref:hypothetical protein n=1 Tax=Nocardia sp. NPDC050718 TaxID=3155788 RepID=UPI0033C24277
MKPDEPMLDLVNGDVGMSRHLAKAITVLSSSPGISNDLRAQLADILQGRGTIRDLAQSEVFRSLGDSVIPRALAEFDATPPEVRQQMAEAGEALLERYRNQDPETTAPPTSTPATAPPVADTASAPTSHIVPGTRKPDRNRVVAPSDLDDDDDQYFQDRNRGGWLR